MRRVLMISPQFPPDSTAGAHRVRLLAPHLAEYGWEPTVVTVDPRDYEAPLDLALADLVPSDLRVVRCRALPVRWTRPLGVGDIGLRALPAIYATCKKLLSRERFDAVFITLFPAYPALLGPLLKRKFKVPFILDYQDPWVGAWGRTIGTGRKGSVNLKSRLNRAVNQMLEPFAVRGADAITAVSSGTYEQLQDRYPGMRDKPCYAIPLGGEPADFEVSREAGRPARYFEPRDGHFHLCYVGALAPLGYETLRAVLKAAALLRTREPELYRKLRLRFFGTGNQNSANASERVMPVARELGIEECVTEIASRIAYLDALAVQTHASGILMIGSTEPHYTPSKLFPVLLARRPILAVYHEGSSVVDILGRALPAPSARIVTYDDTNRAESRVEQIYGCLADLIRDPVYDPNALRMSVVDEFSTRTLAGQLAAVLDQAVQNQALQNRPVQNQPVQKQAMQKPRLN